MKVKLILRRKSLIFYLQKSRLDSQVSASPTLFYCRYELPLFTNSNYERVVGNTLYSGGWTEYFAGIYGLRLQLKTETVFLKVSFPYHPLFYIC
jgi:hypothetical protein